VLAVTVVLNGILLPLLLASIVIVAVPLALK